MGERVGEAERVRLQETECVDVQDWDCVTDPLTLSVTDAE